MQGVAKYNPSKFNALKFTRRMLLITLAYLLPVYIYIHMNVYMVKWIVVPQAVQFLTHNA